MLGSISCALFWPMAASAQTTELPRRAETAETARGMAMGTGSRASAMSSSAVAYNAAALPFGRLYHLEGIVGYTAGEGRWTLEAGALVLADKGIAAIDELDKMTTQDRSSMHEAMEQQTIHVAKAGLTATLQSRCSILAAANPKFGRFDEYESIPTQINLPVALLSRFDLIFSITDKPHEKRDEEMASYILRAHYAGEISQQRKNEKDSAFSPEDETEAHKVHEPPMDVEFLRKYVAHSKRSIFPVMTQEAQDAIMHYYVNLRKEGKEEREGKGGGAVPITPRQLEAFVRLAEASARVRHGFVATCVSRSRAWYSARRTCTSAKSGSP